MIRSSLCAGLLFACAAAPVMAQSACIPPLIPEYSRSPTDAKRIEKRIENWHACYASAKAQGLNVDSRANSEVIAASKKWLAATLANARHPEQFAKERNPRD